MRHDKVIVLNFGSQYAQLITRRVRECGVFAELIPGDSSLEDIQSHGATAIILSGGPETVLDTNTIRVDVGIYELGIPVLGICYGMQMLAQQLGGEVSAGLAAECGYADLILTEPADLFACLQDATQVWMSHGDQVSCVPHGFKVSAATKDCEIAAMSDVDRNFYGVQFHPEVTHTLAGLDFLKHFLFDVAKCNPTWTHEFILAEHIEKIRLQVADEQVLLGLSGGVDSSVVAALLHQAIGDRLICVFVDTGLLRHQEGDQVMQTFAANMGVNVIRVNAQDKFMQALAGVVDPEQKRKIIGSLFIEVFEEQSRKLSGIKFLAQGTIYPDVIESASAKDTKAHVIKSHHNVGGLPDDMNFELIEPLRDLFKDEVRELGIQLGLPDTMVYRHPFPGPGLAVRILGEVNPAAVIILQQADKIFMDALLESGWYHKASQAFAAFIPQKAVGVAGDQRTYGYVIALRAVVTTDFMTATYAQLPHSLLAMVSDKIINSIPEVARCVYDISSKPPATIEWE